MASVKRDYLTFSAHQKPSVGDQKISALGIDHMGWLLCDGRLMNVKDFLFLFNVIGYSFGGSNAQFQLPNPAGRVPGLIGSGAGLTTRAMGSNVGEETHLLTIAEMPSHNHGTNASDSNIGNNHTGNSSTGITVNSNSTGITDAGHAHSYSTYVNADRGYVAATENDNVLGGTQSINTGTGYASISDPQHNHAITDPTHYHTIATQGGDDPHNNMQPTIFMGNLFIYSGKTNYGNYPYTTGYYGVPATTNLYQNVL